MLAGAAPGQLGVGLFPAHLPGVRPDGYGIWTEHAATVPFLVDYDNGSEPLDRLAAKLPGYARLATAAGHPNWVLFTFPNPRRERDARRVLGHPAVPVVTSSRMPGAGPSGAIWLPAGVDHTKGRSRPTRPHSPRPGVTVGLDATPSSGLGTKIAAGAAGLILVIVLTAGAAPGSPPSSAATTAHPRPPPPARYRPPCRPLPTSRL